MKLWKLQRSDSRELWGSTVLLPVGCVEEHGYLPPETDTLIAQAFCELVRPKAEVIVEEPITMGFCPTTCDLPGTKVFGFQEVFDNVADKIKTLISKGCRHIIIINIHGANESVLTGVVQDTYLKTGIPLLYFNPYRAFATELDQVCFGGHDGSYKECSLLLASLEILGIKNIQGPNVDEKLRRDPLLERLRRVGVVGFSYKIPSQHVAYRVGADKQAGRDYLKQTAVRFVKVIQDFKAYVEQENS